VRCLRRLQGCSFFANNSGSFLTFPKFILPVDDSSDCIIPGTMSCTTTPVDFDSRLIGSVASVSENTRFHANQHPTLSPKTKPQRQPTSLPDDSSSSLPTPSSPDSSVSSDTLLPTIMEQNVTLVSLSHPSSPEVPLPFTGEIFPQSSHDVLGNLSPKQTQEILVQITEYLQKHGRVTHKLLRLIQPQSSSRKSTCTTPHGRPPLLSLDKMSSTAPLHTRLPIQQLSC